MTHPIIDVIIPAFNEENGIRQVLNDTPYDKLRHVIVCNNGSRDETRAVALSMGAIVVDEPQMGYGAACLRGMSYIASLETSPDIVVFMDADYSDYPEEISLLYRPILEEGVELVIGSRVLGDRIAGSMTPQQIFGNWLATHLIRWFFSYKFTDLGPFRAVNYNCLTAMNMKDRTYGWTVEMQVKAAKMGMRCKEVPVRYRPRIGKSKISGTVKGTILAGQKILWTIFKHL